MNMRRTVTRKGRMAQLKVPSISFATKNQILANQFWSENHHIVLSGAPGTGKTFLGMYFALDAVLNRSEQDNVTVIRSVVPTRDMGFLPGSEDEKKEAYTTPYKFLIQEILGQKDDQTWSRMITNGIVSFETTSFIRGRTIDNSVILVDEMQNLNFHELDSVITRVGSNSRIIMCGDFKQSDFTHKSEKNGIIQFLKILDHMKDIRRVNFGWEDCIRSDLVRDYLMTKEMLEEKS